MQQQAFAQIARADPGGFELLDAVQHDFDFVEFDLQFWVERVGDFLERLFEIALIVDAVDQRGGDQSIGIAHRREIELPEQVALQADAGRRAAGEVPLVIIVAGQAAGAGLVDVLPGGVDRQLAGNAFTPVSVVEAFAAVRWLVVGAVLCGAFLAGGLTWAVGSFGHRVGAVEVVAVFLALEHGV